MPTTVSVKVQIPDGYELACDEMRPGKKDEIVVDYELVGTQREPIAMRLPNNVIWHAVIIRPVWQWPSWLKAPWIAMDKDGEWWAYPDEPVTHKTMFCGGEQVRLSQSCLPWTPPPCSDWRQSKRKNPNTP